MTLVEIILLGLGLSMDSFAVSICKGLSMKKMNWSKAIIISLYFCIFHVLMVVIGYYLGVAFDEFVNSVDHWIAFVLLAFIGAKMIKESFDKNQKNNNDKVDFKTMILLAIATSIDALAVGISLSFLKSNIIQASSIIGIIVLFMSFLGVKIGNRFGDKFENKAVLFGGIILVLIGIKILLEHLGVINFII